MSQPSDREIRKVSMISVVDREDRNRLWTLLTILGFDHTLVNLWLEKEDGFAEKAFSDSRGLTGEEFALFCARLHVRPGALQQKLNLNETKRSRRSGGTRAVKKVAAWQGFPVLCEHGHLGDGRIVAELLRQGAVMAHIPVGRQPPAHEIAQMAAGNKAVGLQLLRDLVVASRLAGLSQERFSRLEEIVAMLPPGVKTAENIFSPQESVWKAKRQGDERMHDDPYVQAFISAGMGAHVKTLYDADLGFRNWCHAECNLGIEAADVEGLVTGDDGFTMQETATFLAECISRRLPVQDSRLDEAYERLKDFHVGHQLKPAPKNARVLIPAPKPEPQHPLFTCGDSLLGRRVARVIGYYRRERGYFAENYGFDPQALKEISEGARAVSREAFDDLVERVRQRLSASQDNVPPRAWRDVEKLSDELAQKKRGQ